MSNEIAWLQHGLTLRGVPRQDVEVCNRNTALALGLAYMDGRFERGHRHVHVRRVRRNAVFARSKNGQTAVCSSDSSAASARLALVAGRISSAEIHAPGPLQQIASGRRHVPKLGRGAAENRFRKNSVVFADERMVSQIRVTDYRANR